MGKIYDRVVDFLGSHWRKFEDELANPHAYHDSVRKLLDNCVGWRNEIEKMEIEDNEDVYAKLACRQLDAFVRLCYRDGYAPLLSSLLYIAEGEIYDFLVESNLGQRRGRAKELQESVLDILSIFTQDYPWTIYLHSLVTLQRLKRVMERLRGVGGQVGRWVKQVDALVNKGIANTNVVLPFQISIKWLLEGLIPFQLSEKEMIEIGRQLRTLWGILRGEIKFGVVPTVPPTEDVEVGKFFLDLVAGFLHLMQEKITQKLKLPPIDVPIKVTIVWGEDAKYTQSVGFFREEADKMGVYLFKPPGAPIYIPEEIHLLMHEGIPGHAYVVWLQNKMRVGISPLDAAFRINQLGGISFVETTSIFHEGWAVFAQYLGSLLLENEEISDYFYRELVAYLERFLVLQHIVPLYTVKPHIPRFAEPYQFASYFVGFLLWYMLFKNEGKIWDKLVRGEYPYIPSPQEFINVLSEFIEIATKRRKEKEEKE